MPYRPFGSAFQRRGRPGWYVQFHCDGRQTVRYAGKREEHARKKLVAIEALLDAGTPLADVLSEVFGDIPGSALTFRAAVDPYLAYAAAHKKPSTLAGDRRRLAAMCKASWTGEYLTRIRPDMILRWIAERQSPREGTRRRLRRLGESVAEYRRATDKTEDYTAPGASGPTVNRDLALCSALYRWAIEAGHAEDNPFRRVRRFSESGRERGVDLTSEEARALVAFSPTDLRPFLIAALSTARRRGALLALRWRDIDLARRQITFRAAADKTRRASVVGMTDDLYQVLLALDVARPRHDLDSGDPVFRLPDGKALDGWQLRRLWEPTIERCAAIPLEKRAMFRLHDLRHTAATLMAAAGVSLHDLMRIGGWSSYSMVLRYAHHSPESGRKAVEALGRTLGLGSCPGLVPQVSTEGASAPQTSA